MDSETHKYSQHVVAELNEHSFWVLHLNEFGSNKEDNTNWGVPARISEPGYSKMYKLACLPGQGSDQPAHPLSLIRVFAVCMKNHCDLA